MTTVIVDLVLVFWMLLFGGMALLPILTGGRRAAHEPEDRVIAIAPARRAPASTLGARLPLLPNDERRDRPAA